MYPRSGYFLVASQNNLPVLVLVLTTNISETKLTVRFLLVKQPSWLHEQDHLGSRVPRHHYRHHYHRHHQCHRHRQQDLHHLSPFITNYDLVEN